MERDDNVQQQIEQEMERAFFEEFGEIKEVKDECTQETARSAD